MTIGFCICVILLALKYLRFFVSHISALFRPHKRLFWSKRRYEQVWIAKLVKVSSFKFVAGAEIEISDESRKRQIDGRRANLEKELEEKFVLTREMEDDIERQRQILRTEVERQNAENGRVDRLK